MPRGQLATIDWAIAGSNAGPPHNINNTCQCVAKETKAQIIMSQNINMSKTSDDLGHADQTMGQTAKVISQVRDPQEKHADHANTQMRSRVSVQLSKEDARQQELRSGVSREASSRTSDTTSDRSRGSEVSSHVVEMKPEDQLCQRTRVRAYEIYEERQHHGTPGCCNSDWTQAEHELAPAQDRDVELDGDLMAGVGNADKGQSVYAEHLGANRLRV